MDRGAWSTTVHGGRKELDMTEQLSTHIYTQSILFLFSFAFPSCYDVEHQELSVKERKCKNATATLKENSAVS